MRYVKPFMFLFFLIVTVQCYSQKFSVGVLSGTNRSDIHGNQTSEKWRAKPGPIVGIFFNYSPNRIVSFQTEIDKLTIYYEQSTTYYPIYFLDGNYNLVTSPYTMAIMLGIFLFTEFLFKSG